MARLLSLAVMFGMLGAHVVFAVSPAYADQITTRSLTLLTGSGGDGGSTPGGTVNHQFVFTVPSVGAQSVGSIKFEYCTTAADTASTTCVTPTGLSTTAATLGVENGATGFTMNNSTNGAPFIHRSAAAIAPGTILTYQLNNVVNPEAVNQTFFVRISTYATNDASGTAIDTGTVAASTTEPIVLRGTMPESLVFCTGEEIGTTAGVPDCATATPGQIYYNQLFSPTDTARATSQMAASTNAGYGYVITVNGPTLTSGSNTIAGMGTAGPVVRGTAQFGMNLVENETTWDDPVGLDVAPAPNAVNYRGQAAAGYDTPDAFKFTTGDTVANSFNGTPGATDAQIYTVSYIANVPGSQPAGTYATTLTYVCTPTF